MIIAGKIVCSKLNIISGQLLTKCLGNQRTIAAPVSTRRSHQSSGCAVYSAASS